MISLLLNTQQLLSLSKIRRPWRKADEPILFDKNSLLAHWLTKRGNFEVVLTKLGKYRVRFKEWPPLVLGLVTTFLLRLLQFNLMSCLSWKYLSKEVQYISIDQLELKLHIKMCFQSDPNFYVFEQNSRGWEFVF